MTSAKVDMSTNPAVSDIKINGQNFVSAVIGDLSASTETAGKVAEAINKNTGVHGAVANAFNTFTSKIIGGDFRMSDEFEINGETVTAQNSREALVKRGERHSQRSERNPPPPRAPKPISSAIVPYTGTSTRADREGGPPRTNINKNDGTDPKITK